MFSLPFDSVKVQAGLSPRFLDRTMRTTWMEPPKIGPDVGARGDAALTALVQCSFPLKPVEAAGQILPIDWHVDDPTDFDGLPV